MSLLGPLWAWVFIALPLAFVAASLWWYVRGLPEPLPPVDIQAIPNPRRPITREEISSDFLPVWGITATSASMVTPYRRHS